MKKILLIYMPGARFIFPAQVGSDSIQLRDYWPEKGIFRYVAHLHHQAQLQLPVQLIRVMWSLPIQMKLFAFMKIHV